ncbi:E3 SUMO-protein ligase nse2 [Colletotrichum higginsianum IMI 349063]|uniref:E3 SUMO-protein ligase nse2 n=2 Tax=Colletotrichum higginsianum (strain IMI 349063) TaxID=759273 RepID=A0A1B7YBT9_COLHI|nr:E3 SUMO-protein ligase nse2 [Colletotrichum higginsianum IMI 349063]OBR09300.1 E3 SUMO-protein ligase nse2 [Colletotrichum higginsianum IMI 349063]
MPSISDIQAAVINTSSARSTRDVTFGTWTLLKTMPILERRRPGQRRPERRVVDDDDDVPGSDLPEYETLACPLSAEAKRAIADLSNSRDVHRYQNHVKTSIRHLGFSVVGINDAIRTRHETLKRFAEKRAESNDLESQEKSQRELDVEAHTAALEEEIPRLTAEAEAALRDLIDRQIELDDEKAALTDTVSYFQALPEQAPRQRRRPCAVANADDSNAEEDGDAVDDLLPPPDQSVIDILRQNRADKAREYQRQSAYQRYALNNDYAAFKKLWHDAVHGDTEMPLPNAKHWFDNAGNPVMPMRRSPANTGDEPGAQAADQSDEDIVIAGEVRDYRCPLSMQLFENPVSNNELGLDDLYDDPVILRKMKRALEEQRRLDEEAAEESSSDVEDEDEPRPVKREARSKSHKRKVEEIDDE